MWKRFQGRSLFTSKSLLELCLVIAFVTRHDGDCDVIIKITLERVVAFEPMLGLVLGVSDCSWSKSIDHN